MCTEIIYDNIHENGHLLSRFNVGSVVRLAAPGASRILQAPWLGHRGRILDTGWSGSTANRPELTRLMNDARKRRLTQ